MHEDSPMPVQQRDQDEAAPLPTDPTEPAERGSGAAGVMTVVNGVLVGVPAAYVTSHSVPITVITAVLAFGVVLMGRRIR